MYIPATVKCEVCEAIHTEVNGWLSILFQTEPVKSITVLGFEAKFEREPAVCGENCLHTYISQNINYLKEKKCLPVKID